MKYLDSPELQHLSEILEYSSAECRVHTRFEAYSCKSVSRERKLFNKLEQEYTTEATDALALSMSPEMREAGLDSCFGRLDQKDSRQTWFWLIALLNVAFPDHDFTEVRPDHFEREPSVGDVLNQLSTTVLELSNEGPRSYGSYPPTFSSLSSSPATPVAAVPHLAHPHLYKVLDDALQGALADCEVFSYTPDIDSDPHAESDSDDDVNDDDDDLSDDNDDDGRRRAGNDSDDLLEDFSDDDNDDFARDGHQRGFRPPGLDARPLIGGRSRDIFSGGGTEARKGCLWSVNYFFVSRRQKRILFISIWAKKRDPVLPHHHMHFLPSPRLNAAMGSSRRASTSKASTNVGDGVDKVKVKTGSESSGSSGLARSLQA